MYLGRLGSGAVWLSYVRSDIRFPVSMRGVTAQDEIEETVLCTRLLLNNTIHGKD